MATHSSILAWRISMDRGICGAVVHRITKSVFATPWTVPHQSSCPWDSPGKNTGVGCHFLLQGIFPTQGLNPRLPRLLRRRQILSHLTTGEAHLYGVGLCTHTHTHLFRFFSRVGCDKILSILYEHCLDLSLFFLVLPQYLFPCTFF